MIDVNTVKVLDSARNPFNTFVCVVDWLDTPLYRLLFLKSRASSLKVLGTLRSPQESWNGFQNGLHMSYARVLVCRQSGSSLFADL
jgi:hypothetical protein